MDLLRKIGGFFRSETVLCVAAACAAISMCFVPPDGEYLAYLDFRVLCLLFCLMAIVAGLQECNLFWVVANRLLAGKMNLRALMLTLVLLPFFTSMFVTNDVALIASSRSRYSCSSLRGARGCWHGSSRCRPSPLTSAAWRRP